MVCSGAGCQLLAGQGGFIPNTDNLNANPYLIVIQLRKVKDVLRGKTLSCFHSLLRVQV